MQILVSPFVDYLVFSLATKFWSEIKASRKIVFIWKSIAVRSRPTLSLIYQKTECSAVLRCLHHTLRDTAAKIRCPKWPYKKWNNWMILFTSSQLDSHFILAYFEWACRQTFCADREPQLEAGARGFASASQLLRHIGRTPSALASAVGSSVCGPCFMLLMVLRSKNIGEIKSSCK